MSLKNTRREIVRQNKNTYSFTNNDVATINLQNSDNKTVVVGLYE